MTETGAALKKLADATDPLYKTLDDGQKHRFAMLSHMAGRREGGQGDRGQGDRGREFRGRDDGGRDGNGPRRFEGGPRRTELQPQGVPRGENL
jgi:hypothetical protein